MARRYLPSLLFRQTLILSLIAGACAVRAPSVGAALLVLLVLVPERGRGGDAVRRGLKLLAAFFVGAVAVVLALPEVPDKPLWAAVPRQALLVEGLVDSASGLPGGRVRLLLRGLKQADIPSDVSPEHRERMRKAMAAPRFAHAESGKKSYAGGLFHNDRAVLPGLVSLTLDARQMEHSGRPLPGQKVTALLRLFPSGGSRNAGESGFGRYWAAREVWHNARLVWSRGEVLFLRFEAGKGWSYASAAMRESWRSAMVALLGRGLPPHEGGAEGMASAQGAGAAFSQGAAMLVALLFGDRSVLSPHTIDLFTRAGLVHSLALSGQHLALAALFAVFSVAVLSLFAPRVFQRCPRRTLLAYASLPFALAYLFLGGAPFSLVRAALMMLAGAVFLCLRRASAPLDALFAAVLLLFLAWPPAVFELSVQLSVLAVAGIMGSMPLLSALDARLAVGRTEAFWRRAAKKLLRAAASLLLVSLAAQAAVLPILVMNFGVVSPQFWLNLVWLPPLTFLTLPLAACGLLLAVMDVPSLASLLFTLAAWPADLMLALLEKLDSIGGLPFVQSFRPSPLSALGYGAVLAAAAFMAQARLDGRAVGSSLRRLLAFGAVLFLLGFVPRCFDDGRAWLEKRVSLTMIDVGAGQAVLLEYPGGRILVDGGGSTSPFFDCGRSIVAPRLTEGRLPRLDAVIVSHCDVDHARGLRWILEHFQVGALYWSAISAHRADSGEGLALRERARARGIPERILRQGEALELNEGLKLEVLAPALPEGLPLPSEKDLSSNSASLALRLSHKGQGLALLCGDMLSASLKALAHSGQELAAEALVLPHHGAASSFQKAFYRKVAPRVALASAAPFSHFGFPSRIVREEMARNAIPLLSTSELGTFSVHWKFERGRYAMERPGP